MTQTGPAIAQSRNPTLTRGAFLACSWTWCIGMWLPVYLINDFGVLGWVAFAVPNVIGAAAVGFVHRTPGSVARFRARGLGAMRWFSVITILFHVGFLSWTVFERRPAVMPAGAAPAAPVLALLAGWWLSGRSSGSLGRWAVALLALAPALMAAAFFTTQQQGLALPPAGGVVTDGLALPLFTTGLAFGFLLCPHLDLTILRVREETPGPGGDAAFMIGFGVLFLMMIALTALYAGGLLGGWFSDYILLHIWAQSTFTIGAHLRELRSLGWPRALSPGGGGPAGFWVLAALCIALAPVSLIPGGPGTPPPTRLAYEGFLWFYALPLPAAAWFLLRRRRLGRVFWAALILATPAMAAGAIWAVWWAVPVGVAVPLAAGWFAPRTDEETVAGA